MTRLSIPTPFSGGIFMSYRCTHHCKHCMYACSSRWPADWLSLEDAETLLTQLAHHLRGRYPRSSRVGVNYGIHWTGGEPFLNYELLLELTALGAWLGLPATFVETNCYWCRDDQITRERLTELKEAGLQGILISANPFVLEGTPFEYTARAARIAQEVFGDNAMIYQAYFFRQFRTMGLKGRCSFEEYLQMAPHGLAQAELLPNGRLPFKLGHLFRQHPAERFFGQSCAQELLRDWHIHIDNYGNYVPGYCGGLSLGDARDLDALIDGIELGEHPVLRALLTDIGALLRLGMDYGYRPREGYVSKCHLCADVRRHLVGRDHFPELAPVAFYEHLED